MTRKWQRERRRWKGSYGPVWLYNAGFAAWVLWITVDRSGWTIHRHRRYTDVELTDTPEWMPPCPDASAAQAALDRFAASVRATDIRSW